MSWWEFVELIQVIFFFYWWKILLKIKTFGFQKNYARYEKNFQVKIVYLKKVHKFSSEHYLNSHIVFFLIVKSVIKKWKILFYTKSMRDMEKNVAEENCSLQEDLQICYWLSFHKIYSLACIHQKRFYENKKLNVPARIYEIWKKSLKTKFVISKRSTKAKHFFIEFFSKILLKTKNIFLSKILRGIWRKYWVKIN